jgi:hypothetical protein
LQSIKIIFEVSAGYRIKTVTANRLATFDKNGLTRRFNRMALSRRSKKPVR